MTITQPFLVPADEQRRDPWQVLAGGERTGGLVTIGDARIPPRTPGPGRHIHSREDEAIYVKAVAACHGRQPLRIRYPGRGEDLRQVGEVLLEPSRVK